MAQDENSTTQNMTGLQKPAYVEYNPATEYFCPLCGKIVPRQSAAVHVCIKQGQTTDGSGHVLDSEKPTLRDQFAMAALPDTQRQFSTMSTDVMEHLAKYRNYKGPTLGLIAIFCYEMADAMMSARKNPPK